MVNSTNELYNKLLNANTLKTGWHLCRRDQKQNFIENGYPATIASADLDSTIEEIRKRLLNNDYKPRNLLRTDIPKKGLGVRPGTTMWIEDAILMNTILYLIVFKLNKKLSPHVYSFRLRKELIEKEKYKNGKDLFESKTIAEIPFLKKSTIYKKFLQYDDWYITWVEFDQYAQESIKHFRYLATSDISAYFENIQLPILKDEILKVIPNESRIINLLFDILLAWTERTDDGVTLYRGLPQGSSVFSFLGNYYLKPIDDYFDNHPNKEDFRYLRYADDIKIFTNDLSLAKRLILELNRELRKLHLNTQSAKTEIFDEHNNHEASRELSDSRIEELKSLKCQNIDKLTPKEKNDIFEKVQKIISKKSYDGSILKGHKRALKGLDMRLFQLYISFCCSIQNSKFINAYFRELKLNFDQKLLKKLPSITKIFYNYSSLENIIVKYMQSDDIIIPYQKAICIKSLRYLNKITKSTIDILYKLLLDTNEDFYVRFECAMFLCTIDLTKPQIRCIEDLWSKESNIFLQSTLSFLLIQREDKNELLKRLLFYPNRELNKIYILFYNLRNNYEFVKAKLDFYLKNTVDFIPLIEMISSSENLEILTILREKIKDENIQNIKNTRIRNKIKTIRRKTINKIKQLKKNFPSKTAQN